MVSGQYEFGAYRLDVQSRMLLREGDHVALPLKVTELLVALVQAAGRVSPEKNCCSVCGPTRSLRREASRPTFPCCARPLVRVRMGRTSSRPYRNAATASSRP